MDIGSFPPPERFLRLCRAARLGGVGRSLVIEGGSADERDSLALVFASAMTCDSPLSAPCGECGQCEKASRRVHPDVSWLEKDKKTSYSVEFIRSVRLDAYIPPTEAAVRTFIFQGAEELGVPCQNALLKLLEEPPPFAAFVFLLPTAGALLPTVLSRVSRYSISSDSAASCADSENGDVSEAVSAFVSALARRDERGMYSALRPLEKSGGDVCSAVINALSRSIYSAMREKTVGEVVSPLASAFTFQSLDRAYRAVAEADRWRRSNVAPVTVYAGITASMGIILSSPARAANGF